MGEKGDKNRVLGALTAQLFLEKLPGNPEITAKKMFGGHGIFSKGKMFAIVDSKGQAFLKAAEGNRAYFEVAGSQQHSKMPYFSVPDAVLNDSDELNRWAETVL